MGVLKLGAIFQDRGSRVVSGVMKAYHLLHARCKVACFKFLNSNLGYGLVLVVFNASETQFERRV